ncbi:MAG: DUF4831 family protein [Bacteroidales bacterium]|nr:DUF4831 family protein [Bacteroidales bacterium]
MLKQLSAVAILALAATACPAQQTRILTAEKHNEYGLVYSLPNTALRVEVTARHTLRQSGPFWQYAKKFIGTDDVIHSDEELWEITDVKVSTFGVPDPENTYLMQLKPGALTYIGVDSDGMLLSINAEPQAPAPAPAYRPSEKMSIPSGKEYLEYVNEDFLSSQSSVKQAQILSETLMEVRDSRLSLTRGTAETMPTDGRQLELMLQSLAEQEKAMTRAFTGWEGSETLTRTFTVMPQSEGAYTLFRMSDFAGFVDADDLSGWEVSAIIKVIAAAEMPKDASGVEKKLPKDAVMYALPATVSVDIRMQDESLAVQNVEMAQFGTLFGLAPSYFTDKKAPGFAIFDAATGAVKSLGTQK